MTEQGNQHLERIGIDISMKLWAMSGLTMPDNNDVEKLITKGNDLLNQYKWEEAEEVLREATELDSESFDAWNDLGPGLW